MIEYINLLTEEKHENIWPLLRKGEWKKIDSEKFEYNNLKGVLKRNEWKPVIGGILPIYPGMIWDSKIKRYIDKPYIPNKLEPGIKTVLTAAEKFFRKYEGKNIGVQLSGGLDSSIIIGLLKYFNISFCLTGMTTNRYEFRTEKHIQHKLQNWSDETILIDYEQHLPLSNLHDIPQSQYPDLSVLNYSSEEAMANECKRLGVEILFTGDGGDNLLAEPIPIDPVNCTWLPQVFSDSWLAENVYTPLGIKLVSFYNDPGIMDAIFTLRLGQKEDNAKLWARDYFKDFIPHELANYTYCADFWGLYIDGLHQVIPEAKELFRIAYEATGHSFFSKEAEKELFDQDLLHAKKEMYQKIETRVALAAWLNRLINSEFIS